MARKKADSVPCRIWTFGLPLGPTADCAKAVDEQMALAHRYHNNLVEIERARRAAVRAILSEADDIGATEEKIRTFRAEMDAIRESIKLRRKAQHDPRVADKTLARLPADAGEKAQLAALKVAVKEAREARKAAIAAIKSNVEVQDKIKRCNDRAADMKRLHRKSSGVYWGTYLLVEAAVDAASKGKMDPKFKRWTGDGKVGVQFQKGLKIADAASDTRIQIDYTPQLNAKGKPAKHVICKLRIGSEGRAPIWATFPIIMHRPLPADAVIRWAWAKRRRLGLKYRWELQLVIESRTFVQLPKRDTSVCGINFGWRKDDSLRVAYAVDHATATPGELNEAIEVPKQILERIEHANSLRSILDRVFDEMKAELIPWLASNTVPEWLKEATKHLSAWRNRGRLMNLCLRWKDNPFPGGEEMLEKLEQWRRTERHLYQWEVDERTRALAHRKETYRLVATRLARAYGKIVIHEMDLRKFARHVQPEEAETQHEAARSQRFQVAVSEFRAALVLACSNTGCALEIAPSPNITLTCHLCRGECEWDHAKHLLHTCEHCGATWDQDENAARNLVRGASGPATSETPESLDREEFRDVGHATRASEAGLAAAE